MDAVKDILFEPGGDVIIADGDLFVGESDQQHIEHIIFADRGQFRQWPLIGVGISRIKSGPYNATDVKQTIRENLKSDSFNVKTITVDRDFTITVDAIRNL